MGTTLCRLLAILTFGLGAQAAMADSIDAPPFAGERSAFHSYDHYDFTYDGRPCIVVTPKVVAEDKPWIWRARFFNELLMVLRQYRFSVIHFNNGLHGMGYTSAQYRRGFAKLMGTLREHGQGAKLIWASTTPVRKRGALSELDEATETVKERNRIAADFVDRAGVPTNDLFGVGLNHPEYYSEDGVHHNAQGRAIQARQVIQAVEQRL